MNKTDVKFKEVRVLVGKDLGVEIEKFLREDIELIGMQIFREDNEKVAYMTYIDRADISKKYEDSGRVFEPYMYANYHHVIEISVPKTKDLAEKVNEVFANNADMERLNEYYLLGNNTRNAIILYASRSQVEKNEEDARIAQQKLAEEMAGLKADQLAESGIKDPDLNTDDSILDNYVEKIEEKTIPEPTSENSVEAAKILVTEDAQEKDTTSKNKSTITKNKRRGR